MALPTPESLQAIVKVKADTAEQFIAKLAVDMADATKIKNGYRKGGLFSFYIPGAMYGTGFDGVRKELFNSGYQVHVLEQIVGYMPPNEIIDFRNAGPYDPDVQGPSTLPWIHVQISKAVVEE